MKLTVFQAALNLLRIIALYSVFLSARKLKLLEIILLQCELGLVCSGAFSPSLHDQDKSSFFSSGSPPPALTR